MEEKLRATLENLKAFSTIDLGNDPHENIEYEPKSDLPTPSGSAGMKTLEPNSGKPTLSPLNIGIVSDPPTLVLSYVSVLSIRGLDDQKTFRKRKMPLRNFDEKSDVVMCAFGLKQRHHEYLHSVPSVIIEKLLRIVQETQKGLPVDEAVAKIDKEYNIDPNEDLNKLSVNDLERKKQLMEETYHKNAIKPGDELYVYDKQVDFEEKNETENYSAWDDDEENEQNSGAGVANSASKVDKEPSDSMKNDEQNSGAGEANSANKVDKEPSDTVKNEEKEKNLGSGETYNESKVDKKPSDTMKNDEENEQNSGSGETDNASKVDKEPSDTMKNDENDDILKLDDLSEANNSNESSQGEQYEPVPVSSIYTDKIEVRDKSLFEKPDPIKLDELDSIGVRDIEIETANYEETLDDDEFW